MPCYLRKQIEKSENFVGRADVIKAIDHVLLPTNSNLASLRSFCICGFGGIGKTQIAMHYAFEREKSFDAIFWIQADGPKIAKSFSDIALALDLVDESDHQEADKAVSRDKLLGWLSEPRMHASDSNQGSGSNPGPVLAKWLLVLDNADNINAVREYWPEGAHGSILVTSRDPVAKTDLANHGIDLGPMPTEDCATLLQRQVGESDRSNAHDAALFLAKRIGSVPLAITQMATRIRRNDMSIEEFVKRHGDESLLKELHKVEGLPPQEQYKSTLATVWRFEHFTPHALALIHIMVFMDPDAISEFILEQDMASEHVPEDQYPPPGDQFVEARKELSRTSLVARKKDTMALSWHRQVQEVARDLMSKDELQRSFELTIELLSRAWEYAPDRFNRENFKKKRCDDVLPHVKSIVAIYDASESSQHARLPIQKARTLVKLLQEAGW